MLKKLTKSENKNQIVTPLVIAVGVVFFWRGLWALLDTYFLPADPALSAFVSLVIGLGILMATKKLQREFL